MEFIKIANDKYMIKDSNNIIVDEKEIKEYENDNKCDLSNKECKECRAVVDKKGELISNETTKTKNIK